MKESSHIHICKISFSLILLKSASYVFKNFWNSHWDCYRHFYDRFLSFTNVQPPPITIVTPRCCLWHPCLIGFERFWKIITLYPAAITPITSCGKCGSRVDTANIWPLWKYSHESLIRIMQPGTQVLLLWCTAVCFAIFIYLFIYFITVPSYGRCSLS